MKTLILGLLTTVSMTALAGDIYLSPGNQITITPTYESVTVRCGGQGGDTSLKYCVCSYNSYNDNYDLRMRITGTDTNVYLRSTDKLAQCEALIETSSYCN